MLSAEFLTSLEILPTLCRAAGVNPPHGVVLDGFDMTDVLASKKESPRTEMFRQRRGNRAARIGNFKWIESQHGSGLFDLSDDLAERDDLSDSRPDMLAHVKSRFAAWQRRMEKAAPRGPFREF